MLQHHALWASGPLLAEVSVGSIAGSLLLGARAASAETAEGARRLPRLLARYALGLAVAAAAAAAGGVFSLTLRRQPDAA